MQQTDASLALKLYVLNINILVTGYYVFIFAVENSDLPSVYLFLHMFSLLLLKQLEFLAG